jgi:Tfp pilus assembly protein PilO
MGADLTGKNKSLVLNLIVIIIAAVVGFNLYQRNVALKAELGSKIKNEQEKSKVLKNIDQSERTMGAYRKLLSKKDANLVMATITNMAKDQGIRVVTVKPLPELRSDQLIKIPFTLTVAPSSYHALGKFISAIESFQDVYVVDSVGIATKDESGESGKLIANITISSIALAD